MPGNVFRAFATAAAAVAVAVASAVGSSASAATVQPAGISRAGSSSPAASAGAQLWLKLYNGPANGADEASSVAVSPSGKTVYVTGYSSTAAAIHDYATVAYNATTGAELWVKRYGGPGNYGGTPAAVAVSPSGKTVFVTGYVQVTKLSPYLEYATIAYNATTGAQLWVEFYRGATDDDEEMPHAVTVSPSGSTVFVTGQTYVDGTGYGYATIAYNATTGAQLWLQRYYGPILITGTSAQYAVSMTVSPSGKAVFVTGLSLLLGGGTAGYATVAYNAATGAQLWVNTYTRADYSTCAPVQVAVSPSGKTVFVTGSFATNSTTGYATVAYNAATGAQLWVKTYTTDAGGSDTAGSVAVSPSGKTVFVTGGVFVGLAGDDYATIEYNAATGAQLWVKRYAGGNALAAAVSPSGTILYVTGANDGGFGTIGYNAATGAQLWAKRYLGAGIPGDPGAGAAMAVSKATGTVFVTGYIVAVSVHSYDYATIAYRG